MGVEIYDDEILKQPEEITTEPEVKEEEIKASGTVDTGMTLYDLNKQMMEKVTPYNEEKILEKKEMIRKFCRTSHANSKYFMLLSNELHYYTIFVREAAARPFIQSEVIECLRDMGDIVDIHEENDNLIECWVKTENGPEIFMFFPYDMGVVLCQ